MTPDALPLLRFLLDRRDRGERCALVTLVGVSGGAPRDPGTQVAVDGNGAAIGSFTAGCAEAAIVAEARDVLRADRARTVRFGAGSPFIDIRLPCGGGIDLLFVPNPPAEALRRACALLEARRAVALHFRPEGAVTCEIAGSADRTGWTDGTFLCRHEPPLRLVVAGHGAEPLALMRVAEASGIRSSLLTPDPDCLATARAGGFDADALRHDVPPARAACDPHTAVVLMFHDHDREARVLRWAIERDAFFVGAMGSRRTHEQRRRRLAELGVPAAGIARVVGPIGLIEAARDPETLAVSVLAQVVGKRAAAARRRMQPATAVGDGYRLQRTAPADENRAVCAAG